MVPLLSKPAEQKNQQSRWEACLFCLSKMSLKIEQQNKENKEDQCQWFVCLALASSQTLAKQTKK